MPPSSTAADEARPLARGDRDRARRRVPGHVAEGPRPQQVIPVRVGGPARRRAQAAARRASGASAAKSATLTAGSTSRQPPSAPATIVVVVVYVSAVATMHPGRHLVERSVRPCPPRPPLARGRWLAAAAPAAPRPLAASARCACATTPGVLPDAGRDQVQAREERRQVVGGRTGPAQAELGQRGLARAPRSPPGSCPVPAREQARRPPPGRCPGRAPAGRASGPGRRPGEVDEPGEVTACQDRLRLRQVPAM